jgi:transitional endoplasmic reticulum ATPase
MAEDPLIEQLRLALSASPDNLPLKLLLARKLIEAGRAPEVVALLVDVRPETGDPASVVEAAAMLLEGGDVERARHLLDLMRERGGSSARYFHVLARVQAHRRDFGEAAQSWSKAKELDRNLADSQLDELLRTAIPAAGPPPLRVVIGGRDEKPVPPPDAKGRAISFADVGGYEELKKTIHRKIILPFQKPELFIRYGRQAGGGILLYGPPGCGKTHLARATAGECGATFLNVAIEDVLDMWKGESERKLHTLFLSARDRAPTVMFFDEIEALGGRRSSTVHNESGILVSQFLSEMDGFGKSNKQVLVIGATNVPWAVDPAFRRPGRFDNVIFVPPPDRPAREAILNLLIAGRPSTGVDTAQLAAQTAGFSGADLKHLVESAYDEVIDQAIKSGGEPPLTMAHLRPVLAKIKPTTLEWLSTARNYAMYANEGGQYDEVLAFLKEHGR